jgi:predicted enzyme related to lactoylglutathione lyase
VLFRTPFTGTLQATPLGSEVAAPRDPHGVAVGSVGSDVGMLPTLPVQAGETDVADSHGRFIWYELTTTDMQAAGAFYAAVVGWGTRDASRPGLPYTVYTAGEVAVSGMMELPKDARQMGERPMWIGYVCVHDVDATVDRIKRLGGAVHVPPQDILDVSRFAVVSDPQMATFALFKWQSPGQEQPVDLRARGRIGWHELLTDDWEKAWAVYSELFGWQKAAADVGVMTNGLLRNAARCNASPRTPLTSRSSDEMKWNKHLRLAAWSF